MIIHSSFLPRKIHSGTLPSINTKTLSKGHPITLDSDESTLVTLDYGFEVAGFPYFQVSDLDRPLQIEIKYTEQFDGLNHVWADGPYYFSNGLSNSFRVETINITEPGKFQSYFIQGGQRWQSIKLLTGGRVTFSEVGFVPTIDYVDLDKLPSKFTSSNPTYNEIWKLGANAVTAACFDANSQVSTWDITEDGALIRGQKPGSSVEGNALVDYTLTFSSKIVRGGTGWSIAQPIGGTGILLLLVSNLPNETSYANTNRTLTPPNSVVVAAGWGFVNQTTLDSQAVGSFPVPFTIEEEKWYEISTTLLNGSQLSVNINGTQVLNISLAAYSVATQSAGSWGFGPYQDQVAVVQDVRVHAKNGTLLYENDMRSETILSEYGVRHNTKSMCMDGAKRDRLVWMGDLFHTSRIIPASTSRWDYVRGTLDYLLATQISNGQLNIDPQMGYNASSLKIVSSSYAGLADYQVLGLLAFTGYFQRSGDIEWAQDVWPKFKKQISWMTNQIDNTTGLAGIGGFLGSANGTAISAAVVQGLNEAAMVADALSDTNTASLYRNIASKVSKAINEKLWNAKLGVYVSSISTNTTFSVADIAFAITSGVASDERVKLSLARLSELKLTPGFKDSSNSDTSSANISPNTNGFLLDASMVAKDTATAKYLLDNLWTAMLSNEFGSGASWEYVAQDLTPGLSLFTSLSHPWGGAATYVLSEHIAGIRAATPGHQTWLIQPALTGFDLDWVSASVSTRYGPLSVKWEVNSATVHIDITAPKGTSGNLLLPQETKVKTVKINGKAAASTHEISLQSGNSHITVHLG
ncbi:glycoside hydrolase family 78 protein [Penicillium macrosclerotiorum]|uniref:glycoside hydrolase family 78 protein n=1 Tax=Penicillium macrosclerotiorum TaxID=303699 RepID=UPI002547C22C|nr:glycoside hydrolase family 78 protein [Penicillium macrosclerotiorum]KAJ5682304.1 glycoside hydrolase family 78 protein [Penicillium macrosclerotiorum]